MFVWHPSEGNGHSIKPHPGHHENPGVLLRSTKKKLASRSKPSDMGTMSSWASVAIYSEDANSSSFGLETLKLLISQPDAIQQELLVCVHVNWVKRWAGGRGSFGSLLCLMSDSNMKTWQKLSDDLASTQWILREKCGHTLKRRGDRANRYQEKKEIILC